jgi:hypothetical protein
MAGQIRRRLSCDGYSRAPHGPIYTCAPELARKTGIPSIQFYQLACPVQPLDDQITRSNQQRLFGLTHSGSVPERFSLSLDQVEGQNARKNVTSESSDNKSLPTDPDVCFRDTGAPPQPKLRPSERTPPLC